MKKTLISIALVGAVAAATFSVVNVSAEPALDNQDQKVSYGMGLVLGERMKNDLPDLQMDQFLQGIQDGHEGGDKARMTREEIQTALQEYQQKLQKEQMAKVEKMAEENKKKGEDYLAKNAKRDGVETTDSGLQYEVIEEGDGPKPSESDSVTVHYTGELLNGDVFDSSRERGEPVTFQLSQVIPGWTEGLQLMEEGGRYKFYIPSDLAYGPGGNRSIGPNETLVFDVELIKVAPEAGDAAKAGE
ncbi:MAG: peptidylprolyl isomerase [Alteromonadaceae bacterium]|uniref:FKBP-type peptidyl-prolyl cis-trans isomerase n=1 Tax=unclassified Marinobacter TaxID=83889 RepID=UPI000C361EF4|nr:FKBP-type peptidyl-prolyl cis-trans isomerase [Marinobacter sp. BGYM27]MAA65173.1 peptidylprolyl isomerase [Alteromonadaceae bacterium]MBH85344.1 peptidylprolyl isomerase [Alteromonadaceae bacterium]MDG5499891.1 FKBP-type peptidyl-prolyl cis-trans isomerase [Marinobacter sp. BGYM27]|tara:strand:+ start:7189 stop:7923 length:735 start_codon:yes stop_codon:yes gene_type:complete